MWKAKQSRGFPKLCFEYIPRSVRIFSPPCLLFTEKLYVVGSKLCCYIDILSILTVLYWFYLHCSKEGVSTRLLMQNHFERMRHFCNDIKLHVPYLVQNIEMSYLFLNGNIFKPSELYSWTYINVSIFFSPWLLQRQLNWSACWDVSASCTFYYAY